MLRQIIGLLDRRSRLLYFALLALSVAASLLQTVGIAGLSIFFSVLLGGKAPPLMATVVDRLPLPSLSALVFTVLLLGTLTSALTTYLGISLAWRQYQQIATRALQRFLDSDYEWHLQQNSTTLIKTIISETQSVTSNILQQMVLIAVRLNELLFIGLLLLVSKPMVALATLFTFGSLYSILYLGKRYTISQLGHDVSAANKERQQAVTEALTGLKVIKVMGIERHFLDRFNRAATHLGKAQGLIQYYSLLPKYFIELILFSGLLGFITVSHSRNWSTTESIPLLALYGAAAIRLLPAAQQLYASLTIINGTRAALDNVWNACTLPPGTALTLKTRTACSENLLEFRDISYSYPNAALPALQALSFTIAPGEKIGLVGSTGAGKTTTVDLLLGLLAPTSGAVARQPSQPGHRDVSYVPQQLHFVDDSVAANIALGVPPDQVDWERLERVAKTAQIHDVIQALPQGYHTPVGEQGIRLSGGQRQRLGIARALYQQPAILVLDEASNALDAETERQVVQTLLQTDVTVIIIAHRISILRGCHRILVMENGRVQAEGSFEELQAKNDLFQRLAHADLGGVS